MKCDNCGNTIEKNTLVCPFCNKELKSPDEEIEVLDDTNVVEENKEPSIISSEDVLIEDSEEYADIITVPLVLSEEVPLIETEDKSVDEVPEKVYEPIVNSENIVPLPPKRTLLYRIKDFYNSWFEGYEKAAEIKVDNRETRLSLDKIYENNADFEAKKKINFQDVTMTWLICFVVGFIIFFLFTAISFMIDIAVGDHNNIPLLTVIIPIFQIGIPLILIGFGWVIGILYSYFKKRNVKNR